ncbi:hypothetical protein NC652_004311 [Populus alba x Populus x berolinensis]|nr:hypothetical protein NC652_004311 [Populus alba x Populus x berolinensis]
MAEGEEVWYSIYEARDENMVSKDGILTVRIARFIKPLVQCQPRFLTFHCCLEFSPRTGRNGHHEMFCWKAGACPRNNWKNGWIV